MSASESSGCVWWCVLNGVHVRNIFLRRTVEGWCYLRNYPWWAVSHKWARLVAVEYGECNVGDTGVIRTFGESTMVKTT